LQALCRCPLLFQQLLLQPAFQTLIVGFIIQGIHSLLLLGLLLLGLLLLLLLGLLLLGLLCPLQLLALLKSVGLHECMDGAGHWLQVLTPLLAWVQGGVSPRLVLLLLLHRMEHCPRADLLLQQARLQFHLLRQLPLLLLPLLLLLLLLLPQLLEVLLLLLLLPLYLQLRLLLLPLLLLLLLPLPLYLQLRLLLLQLLAAGGLQGPLLLALVQPERSPAGWLRVHLKVLLRHLRGRDVRWGLLL